MKFSTLTMAFGFVLSGLSQAADLDLGDVTGSVFNPSIVHVSGNFLDRYFFQINTDSVGTGTISDVEISLPGGAFLWNIDNLTTTIYLDTSNIGSYDAGSDDATYLVLGSGDFMQDSGPLPAGNYFFTISGQANGNDGGVYMWHASAQPVPEAETWVLMAAGLGLLGMQLRRRPGGGRLMTS